MLAMHGNTYTRERMRWGREFGFFLEKESDQFV